MPPPSEDLPRPGPQPEDAGLDAPPGEGGPLACVLAVGPALEVSVEALFNDPTSPQVHVHAGGQGLWVARMVVALGGRAVVCAPFGGETGIAAAALARAEGLDLRTTQTTGNSAHIVDYRRGTREEVVIMRSPALDRHAQDDLFGTMLVHALEADVCVLTGADPDLGVPPDFFGRLAADLRASGRRIVADLSGDQARAVAEAGGVILKISHEEMLEGGFAGDDAVETLRDAGRALVDGGLEAVVVSRAEDPTLVVTGEDACLVAAPPVTTTQHKGAGDSMTAGIAVGTGRGEPLVDAVRLGAAAGALNVTRRGLGTGRRDQIEAFAGHVEVTRL
ncbi:1-phosphofructokinase family hexose kinase [Georgenia ruanii]|uniref:Phosphofructokinase n=1 Tax=Georgenia ruanii TaxID=348442 RepID=A0A7J9UW67_9MICO|nr:PfkB family carbohydrate kinase [Georgenia ruanii]MPV88869.1 phosphofructokinase [Georgenia ruanii]